ncbi:hypothetical protein BC332_01159 [Capsicum chinense]|nr:hypothetical protein BC332_01159 [Capsicum chinense]
MVCTRPDIAHAIGVVTYFLSNLGREHWNAVKWIMRYLYGTSSMSLCFGKGMPILCGYIDLDMAEAELIVVVEACKELLWMKRFLRKLGVAQERECCRVEEDDDAPPQVSEAQEAPPQVLEVQKAPPQASEAQEAPPQALPVEPLGDPSVIVDTFPLIPFWDERCGHFDTCCICTVEFDEISLLRALPCSHIFHHECILEWLFTDARQCPYCQTAKIADFRFAKKVGIEREKRKLRGTPMYMTLESVLDGEYGTAVDIWAFGSAMFETITGKKIWDCTGINDTLHLFCKFGM